MKSELKTLEAKFISIYNEVKHTAPAKSVGVITARLMGGDYYRMLELSGVSLKK